MPFVLVNSTTASICLLYVTATQPLLKIQPQTIDLSTRFQGINTEFVEFVPQSLLLRSIVWDWIKIYRNWSIGDGAFQCVLGKLDRKIRKTHCFEIIQLIQCYSDVRCSKCKCPTAMPQRRRYYTPLRWPIKIVLMNRLTSFTLAAVFVNNSSCSRPSLLYFEWINFSSVACRFKLLVSLVQWKTFSSSEYTINWR